MNFDFKGLMAPVFATFHDDENKTLNLDVVPKYAAFLNNSGITGLLINGTSGEGMSLSVKERIQITEVWLKSAQLGQHVMVQVGGAPLPDVLELAKHAEKSGAHSILCLPDLYNKPLDCEQLVNYLKIVAASAPNTPLLYYHIPMFTNVTIHMGKFLNYIEDKIPNFVGIKFTSNALDEGIEAVSAHNKKFRVFLGADTLMLPAYTLGFDSAIATTLNFLPGLGVNILKYTRDGQYQKARTEQEQLSKVVGIITKYGGWVASMKVAMNQCAINCGPVRDPIHALTSEKIRNLNSELQILLK